MAEIRRSAAMAEGKPPPPADVRNDGEPEVYVGVDDEAIVRRVMARLAALRDRNETDTQAPAGTQTAFAAQTAFDATRYDDAAPRGWLHRQLGKCRRWLFRVTRIEAALERLQERVNADMLELEQRTSQSVLQLQLFLESQARSNGESAGPELSLSDPLYRRLEARFRGSEAEIRARAADYLPFIREAVARAGGAGAIDLLDIGCGRGELLDVARAAGFAVLGVDANSSMLDAARAKNLPVEQADLREFLLHCPAAEFRCVTLVHVVEHLHVTHLPALLVELKRIIAPGGRLLLEFPNIGNLLTAANRFYIDYTHHRPLHADTVKLFCEAAGFSGVFSHGLHPADESERFERVCDDAPDAAKINRTIDRLNDLLYGPQDVLIVAERETD